MSPEYPRLAGALAGRYRSERELGGGGMSQVFAVGVYGDLHRHRASAGACGRDPEVHFVAD